MKQRVLVTGGAGFIGSHLADQPVAHERPERAGHAIDVGSGRSIVTATPRRARGEDRRG